MAIYTNFRLHQVETPKQKQNLPGLCRYCKTPAHREKHRDKRKDHAFSPLTNPTPNDEAPGTKACPNPPRQSAQGNPSPDWEWIFEPFYLSMEVPVLNPTATQQPCLGALKSSDRWVSNKPQPSLFLHPFLFVWALWEIPTLFFLVPLLLFTCWAEIS